MAFMKKLGAVGLGLSLLIGFTGKFAPHWFMSLPFPLSIILWASTGHEVPPCKYSGLVMLSIVLAQRLRLFDCLLRLVQILCLMLGKPMKSIRG
jgi:hypothetical protein